MPPGAEIIHAVLGITLYLLRIQLALVIREIVMVSQLPAHNKVGALVLRTVVHRKLRIGQRSETIPQIANSFHAFFPLRRFSSLLSRSSGSISVVSNHGRGCA